MSLLAVIFAGVTVFTEPSQTALTAAAARAAHLLVDTPPFIFADTMASALLGDRAGEFIGYHRRHAGHPILSAARAQVVCRSRYAEDRLARAAALGIQQYVIVGAGLDLFGYRPGLARQLRVFEVDHPATQQWKRQALAAAGIPVPAPSRSSPPTWPSVRWLTSCRPAGPSGSDPTRCAPSSCPCSPAPRSPAPATRGRAHEPAGRGERHFWG